MPYAIQYHSIITDEVKVGPILRKKVEKPLSSIIFKNMTREEAEEFCEKANDDPTFENAIHAVIEVPL